jgi:RND family efflux transporter MFP subunit
MPLIASLTLAACSEPPLPPPPPAVTAKPVEVLPFERLAFRQQRDAAATVVSANESKLAAEVGGRLVAIEARAGQRVAKGAVLARLDDTDFVLAVRRAEAAAAQAAARVELAAAQLKRARELVTQGFVSTDAAQIRVTELQLAEADRAAAEAQLATARNALDKTAIRAPFAGVVRERLGQVGETVLPGTPLLTLVDAGGVEVVAPLGAADAEQLGDAEAARFVAGGREWPLKLLRVSPVIDPQTRLTEARFAFAGAAPATGAAGRLVWLDRAASLPAEAFARRQGRYGVFTVDGARARFVVLPGVQEGRPARVALPAGTRVVIRGEQSLQDGDSIAVREAAASASSAAAATAPARAGTR